MLKSGANVNYRFASLNTSALMTTAFHGHVDILEILLSAGADVKAVDLQQSTALGYAFGGRLYIVDSLVAELLHYRHTYMRTQSRRQICMLMSIHIHMQTYAHHIRTQPTCSHTRTHTRTHTHIL